MASLFALGLMSIAWMAVGRGADRDREAASLATLTIPGTDAMPHMGQMQQMESMDP